MSKSRMLISMILIILLLGSISIAYISCINDNVVYIDVNEFGIVINDDSGLILASNIVNRGYRDTTYYKKGYCTDNPVTTLFIVPLNPELYNEDYTRDCYRRCSELIYSDIQNLLSNRASNITLGLNGCYLVSHSVSASPLPHHAIGLYCKDYANKTITMDLLRGFVAQH